MDHHDNPKSLKAKSEPKIALKTAFLAKFTDPNQPTSSTPHDPSNQHQKVAILDKRYPRVLLTDHQVSILQDKLVEALETAPRGDESYKFEGTEFSEGVLWIRCANETTKNWLKDTVTLLGNPWADSQLSAVDHKNVPRRYTVRLILQDSDDEANVRARLVRQNSELNLPDWFLVERSLQDEQQILVYSVDEDTLRALERNSNKMYYKLGTVGIKVVDFDYGQSDFLKHVK
ncbi:unnamed protein product [Phyllotreta striolata]|uniref:DUF4780 domain-containing protein n=1 Tax=Phyllotreta striolata TaxID=444603 RepID=A0A9N9XL37_PHYSR|nr:unnamed protein product [Phyllotreta striolata]